jgi:hypothetical protein
MGASGYLYKPATRKGPVIIVPSDGPAPTMTLADGRVVTAVKGSERGGVYKGHEGYQWVFPRDVLGQSGTLTVGGESRPIENTNSAYQGTSIGGMAPRAKGSIGGPVSGGGGGGYQAGQTNFGGGFGGGQALPTFTDASSLFFNPVSVPQIPTPSYQPIDPQVYSQQVGMQNRSEYLTNLGLSQASALGFANTEAQGLASFAPQQSALQQMLVGQENQFNQSQVDQANRFNPSQVSASNRFNQSELDTAISSSGLPIRDVITEGLERARQLAKGFLPTTIEDRAFEQAARSRAGDNAVAQGLGTSSFTQNAIDKYTIGERLNLAQYGSNEVDKYLNMGVKLLVDSPIKYNPLLSSPLSARTSQDIRGIPSFSLGGAQQAEQGNLSQLTTMAPATSLGLFDQQRQYRAQLENNVNQFNANMDFNSQTFNATGNFNQQLNQLSVDQTNASKAFNFAQTTANYVNMQYQQQLAQYAQSQGFSQAPYATQSTVIGPTAPLGQTPNPSTSTVYR